MTLESGSHLGPYEILSLIGAGGMGEVYKARDTKLGREVAIKVLPEAFSQDKERLARFEREARLLASLNHPNIATIYDLEESDGLHILALELVPGETLAERIKRGPIPVDEALPLFKQIAEGLEAAHEKGVIHRDLKPANIKITPQGKAKVLDFGLAKAMAAESSDQSLSESPTMTRGATEAGILLGTAPYMSPEQARGKAVDKRTDIWAFGCCLYEALTGKAAFFGETVTDTLAKIVEREPTWTAFPDATPGLIRGLLRRCLRKDSNKRLHDIADARIEIEEALAETSGLESPAPIGQPPISRKRTIIAGLALLAAIAAGIGLWNLAAPKGPPVVILMDTLAPDGVYDAETRRNSGTNADDLNHELRDLPVVLHKETVGSTWDREDQILKQQPDLIVIHVSSIFHAINQDLDFPFGHDLDENMDNDRLWRFYWFVNNRLVAFLGYVGLASPKTSFLVYSRSFTEEVRRDWLNEVENRFPLLKGRVFTMRIPQGPEGASFRDPATADLVRDQVQSILGLSPKS
jgi:serine/threonine protein kinase